MKSRSWAAVAVLLILLVGGLSLGVSGDELFQSAAARSADAGQSASAVHLNTPRVVEQRIRTTTLQDARSRVSFSLPEPASMPEGLSLVAARVTTPDWAQLLYRPEPDVDANVSIEKQIGRFEGEYVYSSTYREEAIQVAGARGQCTVRPDGTAVELVWFADGFSYRVHQHELDLTCDDLAEIGGSLD